MPNKNIKFEGTASDREVQKTAEPTAGGSSLADMVANAPKPSVQPTTPANKPESGRES